jgi:hypothetical protein
MDIREEYRRRLTPMLASYYKGRPSCFATWVKSRAWKNFCPAFLGRMVSSLRTERSGKGQKTIYIGLRAEIGAADLWDFSDSVNLDLEDRLSGPRLPTLDAS